MPNPSAFRKIYRILSLVGIAGVAFTLGLILRKSPPPDVPYDPGAATRAELKFSAADQAKAEGRPAQVQLDSTELNSYLTQNMPHSSAKQSADSSESSDSQSPATVVPSTAAASPSADPNAALTSPDQDNQAAQPTLEEIQSDVKDVKVDMDGDLVKAYVVYNLHGKDVSLELDGHVGAKDGYLDFQPVAGKVGSMPLPASVLASAVDKMMASPENREKLRLPDDITGIQIVNGQAVLSYK